jgi:hypothetical protein
MLLKLDGEYLSDSFRLCLYWQGINAGPLASDDLILVGQRIFSPSATGLTMNGYVANRVR